MKKLIVGFGDSWTYGSELEFPQQQCWVTQVANLVNADYKNLGTPASSIGYLTNQLFDFIKQKPNDCKIIFMVGLTGLTRYLSYSNALQEFINITPEANYRTTNIPVNGRPPDIVIEFGTLASEMYRMVECVEYNQFIATQAVALFQNYCSRCNIDVIFFSYFDLCTFDSALVDTSLIYPTTLTYALTGQEYDIPKIRDNEYFQGKLFHPNKQGHTKIAELLKDFYDTNYSRD
jgi:lysophospholipase L1-like esterase